jgi:hypothetical protein
MASTNPTPHYLTYPFPLADESAGGLPSVLLREARLGHRDLHVLSTDEKSGRWNGIEIHAAAPESEPNGDRFKLWFGTGYWQLLFPEAHTSPDTGQDVLAAMYEGFESAHTLGSLELMLDYVRSHMPDRRQESIFNARFDSLVAKIPAGANVNVQDPIFFVPLLESHAQALRDRGCWVTAHIHTSIPTPDVIEKSPELQRIVRALSQNNVLYLHTDELIERMQGAFEVLVRGGELERDSLPAVRRFDLGVDQEFIRNGLARVNRHNFAETIPGFQDLPAASKALVTEAFRSQGTVRHRFFNGCRADQAKDLSVVYDAVRGFLNGLREQGMSVADIRDSYRFFFLNDFIDKKTLDPTNLMHQYIRSIQPKIRSLVTDYPGIVFVSDALRGPQRIAIPSLSFGCHSLVGAKREGLNLMGPETLVVNRDEPTHLIMGSGAGFASQAIRMGHGKGAIFTQPGSTNEMLGAIRTAVATKPDLQARTRLVGYIDSRRDSVVVGRE